MIFLSITIFTIRLITSSSLNSLKQVRYLISKLVSLFRNLERVKSQISLSKSGVYSLNLARIFSFFEGVFAKSAKFSFLDHFAICSPGTVKRSEISGFSLAMFFDKKQEMAKRIAQSIKIIKACYNILILLKFHEISISENFILKSTFYYVDIEILRFGKFRKRQSLICLRTNCAFKLRGLLV